MKNKKLKYSDKPFGKRFILFMAGFSNFFIGYALYYIFKDDKSKEFETEFIQRGAAFGVNVVCILGAIAIILHYVFNLF